jgi:putative endonuclease
MYYVYLLENNLNKRWYIGYTSDLKRRINEHNNSKGGKTTKQGLSWTLIYYEAYLNKNDANGREIFLKSGSGHRFIKKQLKYYFA